MHAESTADGPWKGTKRNCIVCGAEFRLKARKTQTFCSRRCAATTNHGSRKTPSASWRERFWKFVPDSRPDGCWEWTGSRDRRGYGRLQRGRRGEGVLKAHRASYEIHYGPLEDGLLVLHSCDNPPCVNPAHLSAGTNADNSQDMIAKGRGRGQFGSETR